MRVDDPLLNFEQVALVMVATVFLAAPQKLEALMFTLPSYDPQSSVVCFCMNIIGAFQLALLFVLRRLDRHSVPLFREMFVMLHTALLAFGLGMLYKNPSVCKPPFSFFVFYHGSAAAVHAIHHFRKLKKL